jgi:membrane fusion protein (multidrug efflux system)
MNKTLIMGSLMLLVLFSSCKNKQTGANNPNPILAYPVEVVAPQNVELKSVYPAVLKGQEDVDIKPRVDGFIEKVFVDEGSVVRKGQPLFKINTPTSVQAVQTAQSAYNTAKLDVDRIRPLADKGIYSTVKLSTYENVLANAKGALNEAKAKLSWATVTSPVNGIVGTINFRQGSLVNNTNVLTTVANTTNIIAYFSINEKDLLTLLKDMKGNTQAEKIKNMARVKLLLSDGTEYEETGKIETISGVVDATSGAVNFRASFPNKHGLLRSGSSGKVVIPQPVSNVIVIPQEATFNQQDKVMVYKVLGDSVVQKSILVKATPDGKSYVVLDGLASGEKIVSGSIATLKSGQKIKVKSLK